MIFSRNIIEQVFLTSEKLEMDMPEVFKTKYILNFRKCRKVEKKFRFGWVKIGKIKSNKIEKTEELIAQYSIKVYESQYIAYIVTSGSKRETTK